MELIKPNNKEVISIFAESPVLSLDFKDHWRIFRTKPRLPSVVVKRHEEDFASHDNHAQILESGLSKQLQRRWPTDYKKSFSIEIDFSFLELSPYFRQTNRIFEISIIIGRNTINFVLRWFYKGQQRVVSPTLFQNEILKSQGAQSEVAPKQKVVSPKIKKKAKYQEELLRIEQPQPIVIQLGKPTVLQLRLAASQGDWLVGGHGNTATFAGNHVLKLSFEQQDKSVLDIVKKVSSAAASSTIHARKDSFGDIYLTLTLQSLDTTIQRVVRGAFVVQLMHRTQKQKNIESAPILFAAQRAKLPGLAAIDFGTTNSACVYHDPTMSAPVIPERSLSPIQNHQLSIVVYDLLSAIEENLASASDGEHWHLLSRELVVCAQELWGSEQGGRIRRIADIRAFLKGVRQRGQIEDVYRCQSDLLVRWGTIHHRRLQKENKAAADKLRKEYSTCLKSIFNVDIQADFNIVLPEMEPSRLGTISSVIRLVELKESNTRLYDHPQIDSFNSIVDMGTTVENVMREAIPDSNRRVQEGIDQSSSRTIYNIFVAGAKRWIGQDDRAYFIDSTPKIFEDSYAPICKAAVRKMLSSVEQYASAGKEQLSDVVITYPANMPQHRRDIYRQMLYELGVEKVNTSFDEATAGALYYVWKELLSDTYSGIDGFLSRCHYRVRDDRTGQYFQNILLYDMGGGTTDIALLEVALEERVVPGYSKDTFGGRYFSVKPRILGLTGKNNYGGDNVTLAVFRILKSKIAELVAKAKISKPSKLTTAVASILDEYKKDMRFFSRWFTDADDCHSAYDDIADQIEVLVPTRFKDNPQQQALFFDLWLEAENIKRGLSHSLDSGYNYDTPSYFEVRVGTLDRLLESLGLATSDLSLRVDKEEMEQVVRSDLFGSFRSALNLCATRDPVSKQVRLEHYIDRVILAGSSSHLRLVRQALAHEVLTKPFSPDNTNLLPAPFRLDQYNLVFIPEDAKLAVARGACLPRYFQRVKADPNNSMILEQLRMGNSYIDFDVNNVQNYIPFYIRCTSGMGEQIIFEAGEKMLHRDNQDGKPVARRKIVPLEVLTCYRTENNYQTAGEYYCQFNIDEWLQNYLQAEGVNFQYLSELEQEARRNQYFYFMQFDTERVLRCFAYTHPSNLDPNYVAQLIPEQRPGLAKQQLLKAYKPGDTIELQYGENRSGGQKPIIVLVPKVDQPYVLEADNVDLLFSDEENSMAGVFDLYAFRESSSSELIWQIDLSSYKIKTPYFAKLRLRLDLSQDRVSHGQEGKGESMMLEYTIFDPDLSGNPIDNQETYLHYIEAKHSSKKSHHPFDPFRGDQ